MQNEASIQPLSLKEIMDRLSQSHPARKEYEKLLADVKELNGLLQNKLDHRRVR